MVQKLIGMINILIHINNVYKLGSIKYLFIYNGSHFVFFSLRQDEPEPVVPIAEQQQQRYGDGTEMETLYATLVDYIINYTT